jgi:hypothetical protein
MNILVKCNTCTKHIPCISNKFRLYVQKNLDSIYIAYAMYIIHIFFVYKDDIPKLTQWAVAAVQTNAGRRGWAG